MAVKAPSDEVKRVIAVALDAAFYRSVYEDIGPWGDALGHYSLQGWREGRDPAPWFSNRRYLSANPDIAEAGMEPLHHYLTLGRYEGRDVYPSDHANGWFTARVKRDENVLWSAEALFAPPPGQPQPQPQAEPGQVTEEGRALAATEFDAAYYLSMNPDVEAAGSDPLEHFLVAGWREGRDPNPRFCVRDYLETHPDIVAAGVNPFLHYLQAGRAEGRAPRNDLGFRYEILANQVPVGRRVAMAAEATAATARGSAAALVQALSASRTGLRDLHVTFSHDDYTANIGGVQLCLQREGARIAKLGRDHLHIFPAKAWPVVRARGEPAALGVLWNGRPAGVYAPRTLAQALAKTVGQTPGRARSFAIHSLLGHSASELVKILSAAGLKAGFFWLHDFASLCAGYHLLRDDVQDCAAPPPNSAACGICIYGPWRARHLSEHEALFKALDLTVVSPSQPTLDLWRGAWAFPAKGEVVLPHARLVARGQAPMADAATPFRLAFAGLPAAHKGWPVFRDLALRFADDRRYDFVHLGSRTVGGLPVRFEPVTVSAAKPRAMQAAIEAFRADAVLVWPLCRETFSFTAHEAVAAGAAVITNPDSGNVAAFVAEGPRGQVFADEAALTAAFESGEILHLARAARRPKRYDLRFSALTVDLLEPVA